MCFDSFGVLGSSFLASFLLEQPFVIFRKSIIFYEVLEKVVLLSPTITQPDVECFVIIDGNVRYAESAEMHVY